MNEEKRNSALFVRTILFIFGLSGAAALIYEVAWIRSLSRVLGGTTFAMSTMMSAFMAGLALGGFAGGWAGARARNAALLFGLCEFGAGIFGLATVPAINAISPIYFFLYNKYHLTPNMFFAAQFALCFAIMLVPTTLIGATFPVVSKIAAGNPANTASRVGAVYSINILGGILGALAAGFLLIPLLGIRGAVQVAAWVNLFVGLTAVVCSGAGKAAVIGGMGIAAVTVMNLAAAKSEPRSHEYNYYIAGKYDNFWTFTDTAADYKLLFSKEDPAGAVRVYYRPTYNTLSILNDGRPEGSTGNDMETALLLAYLPLATMPDAKSALGIGLGSGMTLRAVKNKLDDVDWVETNPAMIEAVNDNFYPDMPTSGANVIVDDARRYLQTADKKYDIIVSHPSLPVLPEASALYTKEFFETAARRLNPGGVMCQWFPYFEYSNDSIRIMIKTFMSAFPNITVWRVVLTGELIFIGSSSPFKYNLTEIGEKLVELNDFPMQLRYTIFRTQGQIEGLMKKRLAPLPFNTDDKPILEFRGARNFIKPVVKRPGDRHRI